jgi:hypothetical protein
VVETGEGAMDGVEDERESVGEEKKLLVEIRRLQV